MHHIRSYGIMQKILIFSAGNCKPRNDFSIFSLFLQADVVVKIVILMLLFASIWSWTIIFSKYTNLKGILIETEEFEEKFYSSETLNKLSKRIGGQPTHPMEAVFFSAMVYFYRIKTGFSSKNFEFKKSFLKYFIVGLAPMTISFISLS